MGAPPYKKAKILKLAVAGATRQEDLPTRVAAAVISKCAELRRIFQSGQRDDWGAHI